MFTQSLKNAADTYLSKAAFSFVSEIKYKYNLSVFSSFLYCIYSNIAPESIKRIWRLFEENPYFGVTMFHRFGALACSTTALHRFILSMVSGHYAICCRGAASWMHL